MGIGLRYRLGKLEAHALQDPTGSAFVERLESSDKAAQIADERAKARVSAVEKPIDRTRVVQHSGDRLAHLSFIQASTVHQPVTNILGGLDDLLNRGWNAGAENDFEEALEIFAAHVMAIDRLPRQFRVRLVELAGAAEQGDPLALLQTEKAVRQKHVQGKRGIDESSKFVEIGLDVIVERIEEISQARTTPRNLYRHIDFLLIITLFLPGSCGSIVTLPERP